MISTLAVYGISELENKIQKALLESARPCGSEQV